MLETYYLKNGRPYRIRAYEPRDRAALRDIFCQTAHHGKPSQDFFDDGVWLADLMTLYYTDIEPESTFVAEIEGTVAGYLTGTSDSGRFRREWPRRVLPRVMAAFFLRRVWKSWRTWAFLWQGVKSGCKGESRYPASDFKRFPAHFHINVRPGFQAQGIGRGLATAFLARMKSLGRPGVHVRTARSDGRHPFFESLGFKRLYSRRLTLWTYLGEPACELITYGLRLKEMEEM